MVTLLWTIRPQYLAQPDVVGFDVLRCANGPPFAAQPPGPSFPNLSKLGPICITAFAASGAPVLGKVDLGLQPRDDLAQGLGAALAIGAAGIERGESPRGAAAGHHVVAARLAYLSRWSSGS